MPIDQLTGQPVPVPTPSTPAAKGVLDSINATLPPKRGKGMPPAGGGDTSTNNTGVRG